jgi:hypothetical protein
MARFRPGAQKLGTQFRSTGNSTPSKTDRQTVSGCIRGLALRGFDVESRRSSAGDARLPCVTSCAQASALRKNHSSSSRYEARQKRVTVSEGST